MSHIIRLSALFFILFASLQWVHARDFRDIESDHPNHIAVDYLSDQEVIRGQGESTRFDPDGLLNRAEWPVILARQAQVDPSLSEYSLCFPDVATEWFAPAVCYAVEQGWVKGYQAGPEEGRYIPTNTLTLAEVLVMLERRFSWNTEPAGDWFTPAYNFAFAAGIITPGEPLHQPVTRAEATEILFRSIAIKKYSVSKYDPLLGELLANSGSSEQGSETPDDQPDGGNLPKVIVQPFPVQPNEASVARGATYVPVLRFTLEANQPVALEQFTIHRVSVGRTQDLAYTRLSANGKTLEERNFSGESNSVLWNNIYYELEPNNPIVFEMNVDFIESAQSQLYYQFQLDPGTLQFDQAVQVEGGIFSGESFRTVEIPAKTVTITNPSRGLNRPFVEDEGGIIGRFDITAGEHDVLIKRIRLEDAEDVSNLYFSNFRITVGSQEVGSLEAIERNELDFLVSDYYLEAGRTRTFTVRADIGNARVTDAIRLYMEDPEDLHAFDLDFNFGVRVANEFSRDVAWCVGSESVECPAEGLRKRCDKDDVEIGVRDCEEEEEEDPTPEICDDRLAPVCGQKGDVSQTYTNRCQAEQDEATGILPGPCE